MNEQTKELVALGASVAAHCQPCLKFHYAKALDLGLSKGDIEEAIAIGHQVESGANEAIRDFGKTLVSGESTATENCCGGSSKPESSCC